MDKRFIDLPLRKGVGVALLNNNNQIFVAKRIDNPNDFWQMPQGGIDKGENPLEAAFRELKEETSIKNVKLIQEVTDEITYLLPDSLLGIIWKGKFKGQTQKWFIMRFIGKDNEINLRTKHPEFLEWKWVNIESITDKVVDFKLHVYERIKKELKNLILI
jgi:putative (di)nucleoside polyphosphate hydrolase|tara:strand:+ start:373 stop:852 length:480 start_codon:yes stop_codon:yes gene_type:complete